MDPQFDQMKQDMNTLVEKQSRLFSFLIDPDPYLLGVALLSGGGALFFILLNILALNCVFSDCSALEDESNNVNSWLIFEGLTAFFSLSCVISLRAFWSRRKDLP